MILLLIMARLERFELPTPWFVAKYSIQLSYRRVFQLYQSVVGPTGPPATALGHSLVTPWSLRVRCGKSSSPKLLILLPNPRESNHLLTSS
jgi:hypothetical protein